MFHDDHDDPIPSDPTTQSLLLPCPICRREVLCTLRDQISGRYTPSGKDGPHTLLLATHPDSREAVIEQPDCPASGGRYVLVYRPGSTVH